MTNTEQLPLSPADQDYVDRHRRAAVRAEEHASGMLRIAEAHYAEGEWEAGAQAEEAALGLQAQADDERGRAEARMRRAEQDQEARLPQT